MASAITLLPACGTTRTEYVYVSEPVTIPARPDVPRLNADALSCLSDQAYEALAVRDQMLQSHIHVLEGLIRTTWDDSPHHVPNVPQR